LTLTNDDWGIVVVMRDAEVAGMLGGDPVEFPVRLARREEGLFSHR
jgi:hypothetical protein